VTFKQLLIRWSSHNNIIIILYRFVYTRYLLVLGSFENPHRAFFELGSLVLTKLKMHTKLVMIVVWLPNNNIIL